MSTNDYPAQRLTEELLVFLEPIVQGAADPASAVALLGSLGWAVTPLFGPAPNPFFKGWSDAAAAAAAVERFVQTPPRSPSDFAQVLRAVGNVIDAVGAIQAAFAVHLPADQVASLAGDIVQALTLQYLHRRAPVAVDVLRALTIVRSDETAPVILGTDLVRRTTALDRLDLGRLPLLLADPVKTLREHYLPAGLATNADATLAANRLFPVLASLLSRVGAMSLLGRGSSLPSLESEDEEAIARTFTTFWNRETEAAKLLLGLTARLLSAQDEGPGLVLVPFGAGELEFALNRWQFALSMSTNAGILAIKPTGIEAEAGDVRIDLGASAKRISSGAVPVRFGSADGTRFEAASISIGIEGGFHHSAAGDQIDYGASIALQGARLVIAAGDDDGFLKNILPPEGLALAFDLGLSWSNLEGLHFHGGGGLELTLPVHREFLGFTLETFSLSLGFGTAQQGIDASAGVSFALALGPVTAVVEKIGIRTELRFPPDGGNLGPIKLLLAPKPPNGIGLSIDADVVKGGGFIRLEPEIAQYSGVLQLSIKETIDVKAIGILNARLPGGQPGYSLLLLITGEFPPIQLGLGFTLNGIGGLLGINRTAATEVLRTGLHSGALDSILFPPDPLSNVPALLNTLGSVFPVAAGRYTFGPMARFGWGSPTILTLDLALIFEIPDPVRLLILGRVTAKLPSKENALVVLRMDALGALDFSRSEFSLDATLYDSRILTFALSGDMAMRLSWGAQPNFLFSVGGFHPHFQPPAGMPKLARMAIRFVDTEEARLRLESYFALTSNTVQFGAAAEARFKMDMVEAIGFVGFDALFHFSPFTLEAQLAAAVAIKVNGVVLFGAVLALTLTGPSPWHLFGEASFTLLGIKGTAPVDLRIGDSDPPPEQLPDPVDVFALLKAAFADSRNWQTQLPDASAPAVSLRAPVLDGTVPSAPLVAHPLGTISVRQRVAPLLRTLRRYGTAPLQGASFFSASLRVIDGADGVPLDSELLREPFALAQYDNLSDAEKLSAPAFSPEAAGLLAADSTFACSPKVSVVPSTAFDDLRRVAPAAPGSNAALPSSAEAVRMEWFVSMGAAGNAPVRAKGAARYFPAASARRAMEVSNLG